MHVPSRFPFLDFPARIAVNQRTAIARENHQKPKELLCFSPVNIAMSGRSTRSKGRSKTPEFAHMHGGNFATMDESLERPRMNLEDRGC